MHHKLVPPWRSWYIFQVNNPTQVWTNILKTFQIDFGNLHEMRTQRDAQSNVVVSMFVMALARVVVFFLMSWCMLPMLFYFGFLIFLIWLNLETTHKIPLCYGGTSYTSQCMNRSLGQSSFRTRVPVELKFPCMKMFLFYTVDSFQNRSGLGALVAPRPPLYVGVPAPPPHTPICGPVLNRPNECYGVHNLC